MRQTRIVKDSLPFCQEYLHPRCLRATLIRIGCQAKFNGIHSRPKPNVDPTHNATKKIVYIRLGFKGYHILNDVGHKINSATNRAFPATELQLLPTARRIILHRPGSSRMSHCASHLVHQFTCNYGDSYIGRTDQILSQRMSANMPKRLA